MTEQISKKTAEAFNELEKHIDTLRLLLERPTPDAESIFATMLKLMPLIKIIFPGAAHGERTSCTQREFDIINKTVATLKEINDRRDEIVKGSFSKPCLH